MTVMFLAGPTKSLDISIPCNQHGASEMCFGIHGQRSEDGWQVRLQFQLLWMGSCAAAEMQNCTLMHMQGAEQ